MIVTTREAWLTQASERLRSLLETAASTPCPEVRVSVGFPSKRALSIHKRRVGECWSGTVSADGVPQVYVSPVLSAPADVLATLLHELTHATVGVKVGHKGAFVKVCKALGFTKPWTTTPCGPELAERLNALAASLPAYPHSALSPSTTTKQGTRLRLYECQCPVKVRVASDTFDATCNVCDKPFIQDGA